MLHRSTKQGSRARVGVIHTPNGTVQTPGFVPVATNGAIKSVPMAAADDEGCELMFMNCYHLLLSTQGSVQCAYDDGRKPTLPGVKLRRQGAHTNTAR